MGSTPEYGIYYDDPALIALGRTQDETQAKSIEAALGRVATEAQEAVEAVEENAYALVEGRTLAPIEAKEAASYQVGSNFRSVRVISETAAPAILSSMGVPLAGDERLLVKVEAAGAGVYQVGSNFRATTVGGGVTAEYVKGAIPDISSRENLRDLARRTRSLPRRSTAKAAVAIVADDYPRETIDFLAPILKARNLPWGWAINGNTFDPGYVRASTVGGKTWADVRALTGVELVNHGATHEHVQAVEGMEENIIGSRDRIRAETGQPVLGFVPPSNNFPEGVNFHTAPLIGDKGELGLIGTTYDRYVNFGHAWATGTMNNPVVKGPYYPLAGEPRMNANRVWLDGGGGAGFIAGGVGEQAVTRAIALGMGCILSFHCNHVEGGSGANRFTVAQMERFFDWLKAKADAGEIDVLAITDWHFTILGR